MKDVRVDRLIDWALLQLWYSDHWNRMPNIPEDVKKTQVNGFKHQAQAIVIFLSQEVGYSGSPLIDYKGIQVPESWLGYFKDREDKYAHPKDEIRS